MKIKNLCIYISINLLTLTCFANFRHNNITVAQANENNYYATTLDQNGNIDYVTYNELCNLDTSVTCTSAYIPDNSINENEGIPYANISQNSNSRLIFGDDERVILTDPNSYSLFPYRAVCFIKAYDNNSNSWSWGTGFLVGPSTVLTACHLVYRSDKTWFENYEVTPGGYFEGGSTNGPIQSVYPTISSFTKLTVGRYRDTGNRNDDWAILDLNCEIGNTVGYFGVSSTAISVGSSVRLYGYHKDFTGWLGYGAGYVKALETYKFTHDCDALGGSSGGPITFGATTVVGIHSGGFDSTQDTACKISSYIVGWVNERL